MAQAYDFALDKIGMEIMSYQVEFIVLNIWKYSSEVEHLHSVHETWVCAKM